MDDSYGKKMTGHEEDLIAKKIAKMLSRKGVSCGQALRILDYAKNEVEKIPLTELWF